jgi:hypothetical protein
MGYSLSWIAVRGRSESEIHRLLEIRKTGRRGDYNGPHPVVGDMLRNGWYILIAQECDDLIAESKTLALLSKGCEVVACSIEEHVMYSSCAFWKKGKKAWSVTHRGEIGPFDISKTGKLPEGFASIEHQLIADQNNENNEDSKNISVDHVFELPLIMAKQLVGFKHDEVADEPEDGLYEVLELSSRQRIMRTARRYMGCAYLIGIVLFVLGVSISILIAIRPVVHYVVDWLIKLITEWLAGRAMGAWQ